MKKGIEKLMTDKLYRNMYENYKETQGHFRGQKKSIVDQLVPDEDRLNRKSYRNELAKILDY